MCIMKETLENMADKPEKKRKKIGKYDILALLFGLGMLVAGIAGIVTSLAAADDYDNSTDIRTVDAVIEKIERSREKHEDKEDRNNERKNYIETVHKMKLSFVADGTTYQGKYDYRTFSYDRETDQFYNQLKKGDTIPVEVYRSRNGEYKIADEEGPVNFLLYCAAHRSLDLRYGPPGGGAHQRQEEKETAGQTALRQQTGRCFYELLGRSIHGSSDYDCLYRLCCE